MTGKATGRTPIFKIIVNGVRPAQLQQLQQLQQLDCDTSDTCSTRIVATVAMNVGATSQSRATMRRVNHTGTKSQGSHLTLTTVLIVSSPFSPHVCVRAISIAPRPPRLKCFTT